MATDRDMSIMRNAYRKLDGMTLSFGIPSYSDDISDDKVDGYFGIDLMDTLRELRLKNTDSIEEMSINEMHVEDRVIYHALKRFRNTASVFFKFSTATDGKTIDKQMIPKMLFQLIQEYDKEFITWRNSLGIGSGSTWNRDNTISTSGEYSTS